MFKCQEICLWENDFAKNNPGMATGGDGDGGGPAGPGIRVSTVAVSTALGPYFGAFSAFSLTRNSTIRRIRSLGMALSKGNWTAPRELL